MTITFYDDDLLVLGYALDVAEKDARNDDCDHLADKCAELYKTVDDVVRGSKWQKKTKSISGSN